MSGNYVINIGRQLGSGGKEIGEKLAARLGIDFYDKELINLASEESGLCKEFFEKADEKASQGIIGGLFGGIKKEVSIGCAVKRRMCSICGAEYGACEHVKGETYGAERCAAVLCEAVDAYEFSFVAVPAQKQAGVLQKQTGGGVPVDEFALKKLQKEAELGKAYRQELETRVTRAALLLGLELDAGLMKRIVRGMAAEELKGLSEGLERRTAELFAPEPQMTVEQDAAREQNSAFLI